MMTRERQIGMTIKHLSNSYTRFMELVRKQAHEEVLEGEVVVTRLQGWIIDYLYVTEGVILQKDIEAEFHLRHSTVSNVLSVMEERGLITRGTVDSDARCKSIKLTQYARTNHTRAGVLFQNAEQAATKGVSDEELAAFFKVAGKIIANIS